MAFETNRFCEVQKHLSRDMEVKTHHKARSRGNLVTEISAQERARTCGRVKPVIDQYSRELCEPLVEEILAEIDNMRRNCRMTALAAGQPQRMPRGISSLWRGVPMGRLVRPFWVAAMSSSLGY